MKLTTAHSLPLLAVLTLTAIASAQSKVVPPHLTSVEGGGYFDFPYVYNAGRFQQIWEGPAVCAGVALINQVSFRRDTDYRKSNYSPITFPNTTVRLGATPVTPAAMTTAFASNLVGATMTTIVNNVNFSLPAQVQYPTVAPFNVHYPAAQPFLFQRNQGNLIMEWVHPGLATQKSIYTLDGETPSGAAGYVRPFGSFGKFSGGDTPAFVADAIRLVPGGTVSLSVSPLKQTYTATAFFGPSDSSWNSLALPFDLGLIGAPGNTLYTGITIGLPLPVTAAGTGYAGTLSVPLPASPAFAGYKVFAQTWFADANANNLGVVASNALELTLGTGNPYTRMLGASASGVASGFFEKGATQFGGPVVLLGGVIN